ncbi:MAG: kelch repeat-containing protein, partial [Chitinophagales bacterium]
DGDLWLYHFRGSMWKYQIDMNIWTWMAGDTISSGPSYGIKEVADSSNAPGFRYIYSTWKDLLDNFWFFGGLKTSGYSNELWMFTPTTNLWTGWVGTHHLIP